MTATWPLIKMIIYLESTTCPKAMERMTYYKIKGTQTRKAVELHFCLETTSLG
jgi:hypothetical protein